MTAAGQLPLQRRAHRPAPAYLRPALDKVRRDLVDQVVASVTPPPPPEPTWRRALARIRDGAGIGDRLGGLLMLIVATWWQALATALASVTFLQSLGMLIGGDSLYRSQSYDLVRQVPGGMRTYGVLLLALGVAVAIGYGQANGGSGWLLRRALACVAAWYAAWLVLMVGTWLVDWTVYGWNALPLNLLVSFVAVLVAAAVPPDRS